MAPFMTEYALEQISLEWFQEIGYTFIHVPLLATDEETPERDDFRQVVLTAVLKQQQQEGMKFDRQITDHLRRLSHG